LPVVTDAQSSPVKYRADVDGLRALAVLVVIAFHLGSYRFRGGFVGVDVFFVISGFLICSLLYGDLEAGRFSLARFYERRIRRILPALLLVLAATTIAAAFVLMPPRFEDYAESLAAAALSFSNFFFWQSAGYFDAPAGTKPLLHTWSLAVEEQFYLAFPLFLAALYRFRRTVVIAALTLIAIASLAISAVGAFNDPNAAFYLPFNRAWELLLGALLALGAAPLLRGTWAHAVGVAGLALIGASVFLISEQTPFPGLAALPPCIGTAMVIAAGRAGEGVVAKVLALPPIVLIGLMSYSLYLWHWPIIVLFREAALQDTLTRVQQLEVLALCFGLSVLSWLFVERPMRRAPAPRRVVFAAAAAGTLVVTVAALAVIATHGWPQRLPDNVTRLASFTEYDGMSRYRTGACFIDSRHSYSEFDADRCLRRDPSEEAILLIGDSHAAHLWSALASELPQTSVLQATASGCKPTVHAEGARRCRRMMDFIFTRYLATHEVDLLVISASWAAEDAPAVAETVDWARARGIELVVLGPSVSYSAPLPLLLAREVRAGDPDLAGRHRLHYVRAADRALAHVAAARRARYVSIYDLMCPRGQCREFVGDGVPIQYDRDHLTEEGARYVVRRLELAGALETDPG
jgi:peptidoglycan/LPS O-acetylase OafA/YrhL